MSTRACMLYVCMHAVCVRGMQACTCRHVQDNVDGFNEVDDHCLDEVNEVNVQAIPLRITSSNEVKVCLYSVSTH